MSKIQTQVESQYSSLLPTLPGINKDFIGLGHELEKKRKDRKMIQAQQKIVQNRVLYLLKQSQKANKSIQDKKKYLSQIFEIRTRQQDERKQKQRIKQEREQQLRKLKMQSEQHRLKHKNNKHESISKLLEKHKNDFYTVKETSLRGQIYHKEKLNSQQENNMMKYKLVQQSKDHGKYRIQEYLKSKNRDHINEYKRRMSNEQLKLNKKLSIMQGLEKKEIEILSKLQESQNYQEKLQSTIAKAHQIELKELEKLVLEKKSKSKTNSRILSSRQSYITSSFQKYSPYRSSSGKSLPKLDLKSSEGKKLFEKHISRHHQQEKEDPQAIIHLEKKVSPQRRTKRKKQKKQKMEI